MIFYFCVLLGCALLGIQCLIIFLRAFNMIWGKNTLKSLVELLWNLSPFNHKKEASLMKDKR